MFCTVNKMQFLAFFPRACAVVAFVLSILCLLAGYKPGFMENYHIIAVLHFVPSYIHLLTPESVA